MMIIYDNNIFDFTIMIIVNKATDLRFHNYHDRKINYIIIVYHHYHYHYNQFQELINSR